MPFSDREPLIVVIDGAEWDLSNSDEFARLLNPALEHPNVVIDMSGVDYIDSSCLSKLVVLRQRRADGGGLAQGRIVITSPNVRRVFEFVEFDKLWKLYDSLEEAVRDAGGSLDEERLDEPRQG